MLPHTHPVTTVGRPSPQSVDNVRVGNEEVGAGRRLAPTGSTLRVKPDRA
jgi:hypothetical protein